MLSKIPVSVLIPAKNEEANLPACLASVSRADEIFVVDSQSSDKSEEIAMLSSFISTDVGRRRKIGL
jgi:glycosyltransferase involved in cell wall biosynthesis